MNKLATPIVESLKFTDFIMGLVTADLDDATARRRARDDDGPSIAWIVGHLGHSRHLIMQALGYEAPDPFAGKFEDDGADDGAGYPPIAEVVKMWQETSAQILEVVAVATDDQLLSASDQGGPHDEQRVLDVLIFFMWHESYHMGQLGMLRAQFGLTPTATLATGG